MINIIYIIKKFKTIKIIYIFNIINKNIYINDIEFVDQEWSSVLKNPNPSVWWKAGIAAISGRDLGRIECDSLLCWI